MDSFHQEPFCGYFPSLCRNNKRAFQHLLGSSIALLIHRSTENLQQILELLFSHLANVAICKMYAEVILVHVNYNAVDLIVFPQISHNLST